MSDEKNEATAAPTEEMSGPEETLPPDLESYANQPSHEPHEMEQEALRAMMEEPRENPEAPRCTPIPPFFPTTEGSALDAIQSRAVGGRVAVIERGSKKARVVEGGKKSSRPLVNEIPLDESSTEILRELQNEINVLDVQIGQNTRLYKSMIQKLSEQADSATETLNSQIRRILKKHRAPEGWKMDLQNMKIVPPQLPQIITTPPRKK